MKAKIRHVAKRFLIYSIGVLLFFLFLNVVNVHARESGYLTPLVRTVDMDIGEKKEVKLYNGKIVEIEVLSKEASTDDVIGAVRDVAVILSLNGQKKIIHSGNYNLPVSVGEVEVDCPVTRDYYKRATQDSWGLKKDVRLRLWPANSPYIFPGTFVYPVSEKWLASMTWYSNEPVNLVRSNGRIYYHSGMDMGGAEDMVEVYAATDGTVVSARGNVLSGISKKAVKPRYDVVYIRDARDWYYRYSHLNSIVPNLQVGDQVIAGQKLGMLGKEGASGGWSHCHFEITSKQPSGKWGTQDSYVFLWQAYRRQYDPVVLAIARPQKTVYVGETVTLSAGNSWSKYGIKNYRWTLSDGSTKRGRDAKHVYDMPGQYSEVVKVTDTEGNYDYDFTRVNVYKKRKNGQSPHVNIHAAFYPTKDIKVGDKVFFKVRAFGFSKGYDVWDFGDESDLIKVKSNIDTDSHAVVGYSTIGHRYEEPGDYIVKVQRKTSEGIAITHLYVKVQLKDK